MSRVPAYANEEELVLSAQRGNNEALEKILCIYRGFIRYVCQKYYLKDGDQQDLLQEAMIGLLEAVKAYDSTTKVKFRNFAFICIKRELDSVVSRSNRKKRQILNEAIPIYAYVEEENIRYGSEYYSGENFMKNEKDTPESALIAREGLQELMNFLQRELTNLELKVLFLRIEGRSYREITSILEIQTKAVDNAIQRIRRKVMTSYINSTKSA
ncbi:MAG: sigma-70 family RNA polymerase sigma factor [Peptococcaceae bacterium]|nr:sigma-70 family RNA polymerase sigma factor [Peptococcaceae bacterium]MDH7526134.1 sigma-70 family RNA polymerase sigma factor [Peptococcaceae bacterium]